MTRSAEVMKRVPKPALGLITSVLLVLAWQGAAAVGLFGLKYLPTPTAIYSAGVSLVGTGLFWSSIWHTVWVSVLGWSVGSAAGALAGVIMGLSPVVRSWSLTSVDMFRTIPVVAILPIMVLLFGLTTKMELYLVIYACLWLVLLNAIAGVTAIPEGRFDVASTFRLGHLKTFRKIVLPSASSQILVGVNLALSTAVVIAVVAEIIATPAGVGNRIAQAEEALQPAIMFAYIIVTGIIGLLFITGLRLIARMAPPGLMEIA